MTKRTVNIGNIFITNCMCGFAPLSERKTDNYFNKLIKANFRNGRM